MYILCFRILCNPVISAVVGDLNIEIKRVKSVFKTNNHFRPIFMIIKTFVHYIYIIHTLTILCKNILYCTKQRGCAFIILMKV